MLTKDRYRHCEPLQALLYGSNFCKAIRCHTEAWPALLHGSKKVPYVIPAQAGIQKI
ncbi:hypothetical protein [Rickettsia endosymbiont of Orchestes rusci]|uniref:hypothetical protein n=1 Tax=Rickettsia endosymbiont of Orchestes rusci TaxID=3066250 RepID=UPI00313E7DC3